MILDKYSIRNVGKLVHTGFYGNLVSGGIHVNASTSETGSRIYYEFNSVNHLVNLVII